jgi:hypothetical protein
VRIKTRLNAAENDSLKKFGRFQDNGRPQRTSSGPTLSLDSSTGENEKTASIGYATAWRGLLTDSAGHIHFPVTAVTTNIQPRKKVRQKMSYLLER